MKTAFICIASDLYLSNYKVLFDSVKKHVPHATQILYHIGYETPVFDKIININHLYNSTQYTDPLQIICSIRPLVVLNAFEQGYEKVVFTGADVEFFCYPDKLLDNNNNVVLPHTLTPLPIDQNFPNQVGVIQTGHINSDTVAWVNTKETIEFLKWQYNTQKTHCVSGSSIFLDQSWLNCLPFFVDNVTILRDYSYNVAYYNLHERDIIEQNGVWWTHNKPDNKIVKLCSFQYSGLPEDLNKISKHQNRFKPSNDLMSFLQQYKNKI